VAVARSIRIALNRNGIVARQLVAPLVEREVPNA